MLVLADKRTKLISLGALGNRDAASIEIGLETALGPNANGLVESLLSGERSTVGSLGGSLANVGSSSTKGAGGLASNVLVEEIGAVLADQSAKLVDLGTLGNYIALVTSHCMGGRSHIPGMPFLSANSLS